MNVIKSVYGKVLMTISIVAGKDVAKKFDVKFRFHRNLNLKNPQSLADKVVYIENHCPSPLAAQCTDKWDVRSYVAEKGYSDILVPVYGEVYSRFEDIPIDSFPDKFVLKATHGCKMNYFCKDRKLLDREDCRKTLTRWLKTTYGTYSGEWHYLDIPHRIYCEKYLDDADKMIDYKFHCMNGRPVFVLVCSNREASSTAMKVTLDLFDMEWKHIPEIIAAGSGIPGNGMIAKPNTFEKMKDIAGALASDFQFVRVDLYELNGKIYFGELTFTPANGVFPHFTNNFIREMGGKLSI